MNAKVDTRGANVIAFMPKAPVCGAWTVAQHFHASGHIVSANDNYGPYKCEGAQTSDLLLEFLYGVAQ